MDNNLMDGVPVFETIEEAIAQAQKLGCKGYHPHQHEGREVYMPCEDHDQSLDIIDSKGQDIEDVLEDNVIVGVKIVNDPEEVSKRYMKRLANSNLSGQKFYRIVSNPNEPSLLDSATKRYRYIYAPGEGAPDLIDTSRSFCTRMMGGVQKVYRYEDILDLSAQLEVEDTARKIIPRPKNSGPVDIWVWKGGAGCQHRFIELVLEPRGYIPNNAQNAQRIAEFESPAGGNTGQINLPPNYASGFAKVGERGGIVKSEKAPKSDTPNRNPKGEGTAKGDARSTRGAEVSARVEKILEDKVKDFNDRYKEKLGYGANKGALKSVYQRGVGAYNTSHSPEVKSAEQWALARVNAFLYLLRNGRPENSKYVNDNDLLPKDHPKYSKEEFDYNVSSLSPYAVTSGDTEIEEVFINKKPYERKDAYLARCMEALVGEFPDSKQRYAVCNSDWESFNAMELDIYGYPTEHFYICPGAKATFMEIMSVDNDEDTIGMIRSAALIADKIFDIEEDAIEDGKASPKDLELAKLLVDDYKDLIGEIAKIQGKEYNVDYMDGHIDTISKFVVSEMFRKNLDRGIVVDIEGALIKDGQPIMKTIEYLEEMSDRYKIILISGRPESKLQETIDELEEYGIEYDEIYLQDLSEDTTGDVAMRFKTNKVKKLMQSGFNISEMISADSGTLAALEQLGIGLYYPEELDVLFRPTAFAKGKALFETQEEAFEYSMFCGCGGYVSDYMFKGQKLFMSCGDYKKEPQAFSMEEDKRIIYAPVMVPGKIIPRMDEFGQKYFVTFTPEVIEKMAYKYMKEKRTDQVNYEHSDQKFKDVYMVESWVINSDNDKAYNFFEKDDLPIGTWMAAFKVDSDEVWNNYVKANKVKGVSLQGNFLYTN